MLTLDVLRKMAERMPSEGLGDASVYRRPDGDCRVRQVMLPSVGEERRRALSLFGVVLAGSVALLTVVGVVVTHGLPLAAGVVPSSGSLLRCAGWFAGWTVAFVAPFVGIGLARELARYRRIRRRVGPRGWLGADGTLSSEDGRVAVSLRSQ